MSLPSYRICYRDPNGYVAIETRPSLASVCGVLAHLMRDHDQLWVREEPSGRIILVYDTKGPLTRP